MKPETESPPEPAAEVPAGEGLASPNCSPLQFCYTVPEPASRDIQMMSVWSQAMDGNADYMPPQHLRAAWEWFKSWGESKVRDIESNVKGDSLIALAEKWERLAASWIQVARDRNDDAPDIANRAQARAAIYQDCAEDLKANA